MLSRRFLASGYSLRAAQRSSLWREKRFEYPYRDKYKPQLFLSFSLPLLLTLAVLLLPILLPGTLRMESSPKTTPSPRVTNTFKHKRLKDDHKCQSKRRYLDDGDGWSRQSDWPPACHGLKCVARNTLYKSVILERFAFKLRDLVVFLDAVASQVDMLTGSLTKIQAFSLPVACMLHCYLLTQSLLQ